MYVAALESEAGGIEGGIPPNGIQKVDEDNMETKEPDRRETETRNVSLDPAKHVAEMTDLMTSMFIMPQRLRLIKKAGELNKICDGSWPYMWAS